MLGRIALTALLVAGLAGCMEPAPQTDAGPTVPDSTLVAPKLNARYVLDDLKAFSEAFPYRQSGTPNHLAARDDLAKRFTDAGLDVQRHSFPSAPRLPGGLSVGTVYDGQNILGVKWGMDRHSFIVVGAHYDITEGAVHGAYDDGSGTALVFHLAKAFANVPTDRTLVFAQFDQEEQGLVGSRAFVNDLDAGRLGINGTVAGMLDLDMVGITWPHPANLVIWENAPALETRIKELAKSIQMPQNHLEFRAPYSGRSDAANFVAAKIPTAQMWSNWDTYVLPDGSVVPVQNGYVGSYPWWHKLDSYDTMVMSAGSELVLQAGFQTTVDLVSPLLLDMSRSTFVMDIEE